MTDTPETEPVIPDSITPYRGYKALNVNADGRLSSPQQHAMWPPGERLEAYCTASREFGWVPVEGSPREMDATQTVAAGGPVFVTATVASSAGVAALRTPVPRHKPTNPLPEGWSWSWEMYTHDVPEPGCSCGIYVASEPEGCLSYMNHCGIIVEISLWGRVIPAHSGARGQYAYPSQILAPRSLVPSVRHVAKLYNIPILVLDPVKSEKVCTGPGCSCVDVCAVTGAKAVFPEQQPEPEPRDKIMDFLTRALTPGSRRVW